MTTSALSTIVVAGPNWSDPRPLGVADLTLTWAVEQPGRLTCRLPAEDAHRFGVRQWRGRWVRADHPTQGTWGGVMTNAPGHIGTQTVQLAATSMQALFMGRVIPPTYRVESNYAGGLARLALSDVLTDDTLYLSTISADEMGMVVEVEGRGEKLYEFLRQLAGQSGQEWDVEVDAAGRLHFLWRVQLGEDKRDRVLLREGYQVVDGTVVGDLFTITNDLTGIAANEDYARSSEFRAEVIASIHEFGRLQDIRRYDNVLTEGTVSAKVRSELRRESEGLFLPTIIVPALHPVCADIRHGDTIRYVSAVENREFDFRVMSRTVQKGTTLILAGDATARNVQIPVPVFTPQLINPLLGWHDAGDVSTITALPDGRLLALRDKAGSVGTLTGPDPDGFFVGNIPGYLPGGLNGRGVVSVGDGFLTTGTLNWSAYTALTVVLLARAWSAAPGAEQPAATFGNTGADAGSWQIGQTATGKVFARLRGNVGTAEFLSDTGWGTDWHVITAIFDMTVAADEVSLWVDGVSAGSRPSNSNNTGAFHAARTLDVEGGGGVLTGALDRVAALVVLPRAVTTDHRLALEASLGTTWGVG